MSYTVTEATVVFPDKKAASSFSSGYASKKPCAHIDCELEGGFERSIWIPVRVARLFLKNRPDLPCDWDEFREAVQLIERKCALTMVTEMLSRRDHLDNFVKSLEANPKQFPDFGPRLGEISAPTLIVWGRNDRFVPMDAGLRLLAGIAGSELHIYRDCGHWAQWEHADSFNQLVLNFLARA